MEVTVNISIIQNQSLFSVFDEQEISTLIKKLHSQLRKYSDGLIISAAGAVPDQVGLIVSGSVFCGEMHFMPGDLIQLQALSGYVLSFDLVADGSAQIFFFSVTKEPLRDDYVSSLTARFLCQLSLQISMQQTAEEEHLQVLLHRTVHERVMAYLEQQSVLAGSRCFDIPLSRSEMADYLRVDRTVLSAELSRMRDSGLISYHMNHFTLHDQ